MENPFSVSGYVKACYNDYRSDIRHLNSLRQCKKLTDEVRREIVATQERLDKNQIGKYEYEHEQRTGIFPSPTNYTLG
tara:strand:+ start:94 stop:327 length:234 start_codon:yes stop_codon:yes gene_type:complete